MNNRGILTVISGFSGAGKGTIVKRLFAKYGNYKVSISATTRQPRVGEEDGREYFFKSVEAFEKMIADGAFIEHTKYVNNYYGTLRAYVECQKEKGNDVILEIEIEGALKIKEQYPDTVLMFVMTPNADSLKERLLGRGTEHQEVIDSRLSRAVEESKGIEKYDYLIINDDLEDTVERLHHIIQSEHYKVDRNIDFIETMQNDMKQYAKGE